MPMDDDAGFLTPLGVGKGDVLSGEDDTMADTDSMAAEEVADELEAGLAGDRAALVRAVRMLMRRD